MAVAEGSGEGPPAESKAKSGGGFSGLSRRIPARHVAVYSVVGAQEGGWSLTPMENLLRGVRSEKEHAVETPGFRRSRLQRAAAVATVVRRVDS